MIRLIGSLLHPYRRVLGAVLFAMVTETAMSLAAPWPIKVVLDNVVDSRRLPPWLARFVPTTATGGLPCGLVSSRSESRRLEPRRRTLIRTGART